MARIHKHSLSRGLAVALLAVFDAGGEMTAGELARVLSYSACSNFQKLRYWRLVSKPAPGVWKLTELGRLWALGAARVEKHAYSLGGQPQSTGGKLVRIRDVVDGYKQRVDYAKIVKHDGDTQLGLLDTEPRRAW